LDGVNVEDGVNVGVLEEVGVRESVTEAVAVNVGVNVFVREGVIEGVGVKDNAAIASCACAVRAPDVEVVLISCVGDGVWLGATVRVEVKVGGTVAGSVGV
jgi:hypothetical protein